MEPTNPLLPAPQPATPALLRRAGGLLDAVRSIQQEASAEYWFEVGLKYKQEENWQSASLCFDHTIKLDKSHWQGWLLSGLCFAHLEKFEQCKDAIFGAEIYGRPMREADFFGFYTLPELSCLYGFLGERKGESKQYGASVALALVCFHSRNLALAEQLLSEAEIETAEQDAWIQYFLSRIVFEKGDAEKSIDFLKTHLIGELAENPRVHFWIGRSFVQSILDLKENYWIAGEADYYLPFKIEQRIKLGIQHLRKSIDIGPVRAELYFTLGQAKQLLESPRWRGAGEGLREYHAAVKLEPGNEQYIMARYSAATWAFHLGNGEILELIARAEAADITPDLQRRLIELLLTKNQVFA